MPSIRVVVREITASEATEEELMVKEESTTTEISSLTRPAPILDSLSQEASKAGRDKVRMAESTAKRLFIFLDWLFTFGKDLRI